MILQGPCKTCGETVKLDIGDLTIEQVKERLSNQATGFSCHAGNHVELNPAYPDHWEIDNWEIIEGKAPTDEEWVADLRSKFKDVRDTTGMSGLITSFAFGEPMTNDGHTWSFASAPSGKRWYYRID